MLKPISSRAINSAMITTVKICSPTGCFRYPPSVSTLATMPRLVIDSTPANASDSVKFSFSPKSKTTSVVTSIEMLSDTVTESTAARK